MKYLKIYLPTTILMFLIVAAFMSFKPMVAKALSGPCAGNGTPITFPSGLAQFYGYSNCKLFDTGSEAGLVLEDGINIPSGQYASQTSYFENEIDNIDLNGNTQNSTGAAFIMDSMLGVPADSADSTIAYARANVPAWEALVNEYSAAREIDYNDQVNYPCNSPDSAYDKANNDDFYLEITSSTTSVDGCGGPVNSIIFSGSSGGILYRINEDCGNAEGEALPPLKVYTMSGVVQTKNMTTGVVSNVPNGTASVTIDDTTDPSNSTTVDVTIKSISGYPNPVSAYSVPVTEGDQFSLSIGNDPAGDVDYTDYQGATNFTDAASGTGAPYNCGPTNYNLQVSGNPSTPNNSGRSGSATCVAVGGNANYNFIYLSAPAKTNTGVCSSLTTSGTAPTFTAAAAYTLAAGVTYKSASFNWGDGSPAVSGKNSSGTVTAGPHTYTASGTYNVTATLTFTDSAGKVSTSICPPASVTYSPGGGTAPVFTCSSNNTSLYDVTATVTPDTAYIGAGFPASISFSTSSNFDSDANYGISLGNYPDQTSQLNIEANNNDSGLGVTPTTYYPNGSNVITGNLPIQTPVGIYSVSYNATIVEVITDSDPSAHWTVPNPNPTPEPPPPAAPYTSEATSVGSPVPTTIQVPGTPTTGYFTQEKTTTTYTYTDLGSPTPIYGPAPCIELGDRESTGCQKYGPAPIIGYNPAPDTVVAVDYSYQYQYYITWVSTPNVECPPPLPVQVGYQPYMKVYGGDVVAGSTFDPGLTTACTPLSSQKSNIIGWNYDTPNYSGGGTEYAGYALGAIDGFATSQGSASAGIGLSFASVGGLSPPAQNSPSSGEFGGSFIPVSCAPDFFDAKPASATPPTSGDVGNLSGSYYQTSPFTITGGTVAPGSHVTIYVDGNVYIDGNISLGDTWSTIGDIPSFELIVQNGNIYIDNSVTRLDGVYVAQDMNQAAGTGTIYDCSEADGGAEVQATGAEFSNDCYKPLVINGSFIATQVDLMRTTSPDNSTSSSNTLYESTNDSAISKGPDTAGESGNASEVFNYSPAVWLGLTNNDLLGTDTNNVGLNNYNSITSLPPVL